MIVKLKVFFIILMLSLSSASAEEKIKAVTSQTIGSINDKNPSSASEKSTISNILEPGDTAPVFSLTGADGKTYSLKDSAGKIVVLEWFNNDCPFVEKHYSMPRQNMQNLQKKYTSRGIVWYTISSTKLKHALMPEEANKIVKERDSHPTAFLIDGDGTVARKYHALATPHMFVIDKDGKVVYNGAIDDSPSFQKDTIAQARNYVSEVLDILLDPKSNRLIKDAVTKPYGCAVKI